MTDAISPVGYISRGIFNLFNVPIQAGIGVLKGSTAGIGGYKPLIGSAGTVAEIPASALAKLGTNPTIGEIARVHVSNLFHRLFGYGLAGINGSGLGDAYKGLLTKLTSQNFTALGTAIGRVGLPGAALLGLGGVGAIFLLMAGLRTGINGYNKWSDIGKGFPVDLVNNSWVHGLHSATGFATALGIGLALVPGAQAIGVVTALGGLAGMLGISVARKAMGGLHWFNVPEAAPRPFNTILRWLNNSDRFYA